MNAGVYVPTAVRSCAKMPLAGKVVPTHVRSKGGGGDGDGPGGHDAGRADREYPPFIRNSGGEGSIISVSAGGENRSESSFASGTCGGSTTVSNRRYRKRHRFSSSDNKYASAPDSSPSSVGDRDDSADELNDCTPSQSIPAVTTLEIDDDGSEGTSDTQHPANPPRE